MLRLLALRPLLLLHDFFHLFDGHRAFDVNPFVKNRVAVSELEHQVHAADVRKSHKPEASGLLCPFVLQDDAVFNLSKVAEVVLKL